MSLAADGKLTYSYTYTPCAEGRSKSEEKTISDVLSADDVGDDATWHRALH